MTIRHALLLSILGMISGHQEFEPCGQPRGCFCSFPVLNRIHCTQNITVFPIFDDVIKPGVLSITFYKSRIVELPPFNKEKWLRLNHLSFVDTSYLACEALPRLHRPGLDIALRWISNRPACLTCKRRDECPKQGTCVGYLASTLVLAGLVGITWTVMLVALKIPGIWNLA